MHDGRAGARTKRSHLADADVDGEGGRQRELLGWCDMKDRAVQLPVYNKQYSTYFRAVGARFVSVVYQCTCTLSLCRLPPLPGGGFLVFLHFRFKVVVSLTLALWSSV